MRRPLPDFSASLPSGFRMRSPKSPPAQAGTRSRMPSEPTPQLRSQMRITWPGVSGDGRSAPLITM